MVTHRQGHTDEVTRLDIGLLDSLIHRRHVSLSYIILCHMLSTPKVSNRSLPYGSIITRILKHFRVPIAEPVYLETRKLGREIISAIKFFKKRGKWENTTSSKNKDTLLALEDDHMLNDVYSEDELLDIRLGARSRVLHRAAAPAAPAITSSQDDEPAETAVLPATSVVPEDRFQQLFDKVDALSQQQQQLQYDFTTFREQISYQQMELLAGQHCILGYFGYDPGNSSSQPPS